MSLQSIGDYILDYLVVTTLLVVSLALVIPFIPMLVGITGYFKRDIRFRRFKDIFTCIRENGKILIFYTIFQLVILLVSILNIFYMNHYPEHSNLFVLFISYIALFIGIFYLITAPTIILYMNVTFRQLLYNSLILLLGSLKNTILSLALIAVTVLAVLYFPYIVIFMLYFVVLLNQRGMLESFYKLKAKALGVRIEDLKKESEDDEFEI